MIQSVHCPSCDARYGLRRARVRPGIRRAQCFRCNTIFGVEVEVSLLLTEEQEPPASLESLPAEAFPELPPETLPEAFSEAFPEVSPEASPSPIMEEELELPSLEELQEATARLEVEHLPPVAETLLSLDDLGAPEDEFLDSSLVDAPGPPYPPSALAPEPEPPFEEVSPGGGYASAKDAIDKLLGQAPPMAPYRPPSSRSGGTQMDVEATLSALETTLSGLPSQALEPPPRPAVLEPADLPPPAGATTKLTREEVTAAMAGLQLKVAPPAPPPAEPTMVLKAPPAPVPPSSTSTQPGMDPNQLKVQLGTELFNNLTMEQLTTLAEQGRLMEYHMVARQFSDNWLEAGKVPGLRPVFERLRRMRMPDPPPAPELAPKKSLFGGLFGKGNP